MSVHFGIKAGIIDDDVIKAVSSDIAKKYGEMSEADIDLAYEIYTPDQDDNWKHPTKKQILMPVFRWWNRRSKILEEFEKFMNAEREQQLRDKGYQQYVQEAIMIYNESLDAGEWLGTVFQAHAIAKKHISHYFDKYFKAALWIEAKKLHKENTEKAKTIAREELGMLIPPEFMVSDIRLFSQLLVQEAIELNIEI